MAKIQLKKCCNCGREFSHRDTRQKNCSRACFRSSQSKRFKGVPQGFVGSKSSNWKGDRIGYWAIHQWLYKKYGKADRCENKKCPHQSPKRFEWALKKGKVYLRRRNYFSKLCSGCHHQMDDITNRGWKKRRKSYVVA